MNYFALLFAALAVRSGIKFVRQRDKVRLWMTVWFLVLLARSLYPHVVLTALALFPLYWFTWIMLKALHVLLWSGQVRLPELTEEEKLWRETLSASHRKRLEELDQMHGRRLSLAESEEKVRDMFSSDVREERIRNGERLRESEERDLAIQCSPGPTEIAGSKGPLWLQLEPVSMPEEDDEGYCAPISCTIWANEPATGEAATTTYLSLTRLLDVAGLDSSRAGGPRLMYWANASQEFQEMFQGRCVLANIAMASDARERFELDIDGQKRVVMSKYLGWKADFALDPDQRRLWVRYKGMYSEIWSGGLDNPDAKFEDIEQIPAFYYAVSASELLPTTHPHLHRRNLKDLVEADDDDDDDDDDDSAEQG